MLDYIKDLYINEKYTVSVKNFNTVQSIFIIGLTLMTGVIYYCIESHFYTYLTIVLIFTYVAGLIDVNRTGRLRRCAIIMSLVTNLIYFPVCFTGFTNLLSVVPMYFLLGLLYTGLLVEGRLGTILSFVETFFMAIMVAIYSPLLDKTAPGQETFIDIIAVEIGIFVVGLLCCMAVKYRAVQYDEEHNQVENMYLKVIDAYNEKDIFLANTSHEIRTPLNAIVGTVNMLLYEDLNTSVKDNVYNILNSCNALLSITDELMDLSNTENKTIDISPRRYDLKEMITEIINMISVRLMDSEIEFFVDIDKDIPRYLFGDNTKIRQLFINILNNAVKYTKQGKINFRVKGEYKDKGHINIIVDVEDTGIGIKEENIANLFSYYDRNEDYERRNIEGHGIGLNLCKEILDKMGGNISVKSEYHVGSTFTFSFPQQIDSFEGIVKIKNPDDFNILIFERNEELAYNARRLLSYLGTKATIAANRMEFETCILSKQYNYIFIAAERYTENKRFLERKIVDEKIVILSDISHSIQVTNNATILTRPIYIINSAMALMNESSSYVREMFTKDGFTLPGTNIMVVDDNLTNLEVASGILRRYNANIYTALSGQECLNILETQDVDIIFLDYMMPDMNGVDTLLNIRNMNNPKLKTVPVIALTANVVNGAREMFLETGFDEYIAKPIDIKKLEKIIKEKLPRKNIQYN